MVDNNSSPEARQRFMVCLAMGAAMGAGVGTAIGAATDNMGLWLALGIAIGNGMGVSIGMVLASAVDQDRADSDDDAAESGAREAGTD